MMIDQQELLSRIKSLGGFATTLIRLTELLKNDLASISDFEVVIAPDPVLTARLLRVANSPFYGLSGRVTSVQHAISIMGLERLVEVSSSVLMSKAIPKVLPGYQISAEDFWIHSMAVAAIAHEIALSQSIQAPERMFTAGLLHDIGKLAIGIYIDKESQAFSAHVDAEAGRFIEAEQEVLKTDHAQVGGQMVEAWGLPEEIALAARYHHTPSHEACAEQQVLLDLIHLANGLAHSMGYGADKGEMLRSIDPFAKKRLGIKAKDMELVLAKSVERIEGLRGTLDEQ